MKKLFIVMITLLSGTVLMAGGTAAAKAAQPVEKNNCTTETVYLDKLTNLMWQDAPYTDAEDGAFKRETSVGKAGTYTYAKSYCARLNYGGHTDWRLPTSDELSGVHKLKGQVFVNFRGNHFWTSTPTSQNRYEVVYPADAYAYPRKGNKSNYIRCVRCVK